MPPGPSTSVRHSGLPVDTVNVITGGLSGSKSWRALGSCAMTVPWPYVFSFLSTYSYFQSAAFSLFSTDGHYRKVRSGNVTLSWSR